MRSLTSPLIKNQVSTISVSKWLTVSLLLLLTACTSTAKYSSQQLLPQNIQQSVAINTLVFQCQQHAMAIEKQANISALSAQYLAAANALNTCIDKFDLTDESVDKKQIMQLIAISSLNYIKGGNIAKAQQMIAKFKLNYPQQDLYFADYTSFLDTATVLLSSESVTVLQLASLNINRQLRSEIERKHYWLTH